MTRFTPPSDRTAPSLHATTDSKRVISMPTPFSRRRLLQWAAAGTAAPALLGPLQAWAQGAGLHFGPAQPFSFDALIQRAEQMAGQPYRSEEHTSELPSLMRNSYAVFCLEKKKQHTQLQKHIYTSHTKQT